MKWAHPNKDEVSGFTVKVFDGTDWRHVAHKDASGNFVNGTEPANSSKQFEVTNIKAAQNNWKLVKAGTTYPVRILANYPNNVQVQNADSTFYLPTRRAGGCFLITYRRSGEQ